MVRKWSVTSIVTLYVFTASDDRTVPEILPVLALRVSPMGSEPLEIDQWYGVIPPFATRVVAGYVVPLAALGSDAVVICRARTVTLKDQAPVSPRASDSVPEMRYR